eukprot:scaffold35336_cov15-Tisochrysis_lutea.AAC.2
MDSNQGFRRQGALFLMHLWTDLPDKAVSQQRTTAVCNLCCALKIIAVDCQPDQAGLIGGGKVQIAGSLGCNASACGHQHISAYTLEYSIFAVDKAEHILARDCQALRMRQNLARIGHNTATCAG